MTLQSTLGTDGVLLLTMAHAPVNALALPLRRALMAALDMAEREPSVKAVVLTGTTNVFSAGADLAEFNEGRAFDHPSFHTSVLPLLFGMRKPVVAALNGRALGGGLELALWCHARVAVPDAPIGLPETTLALMPGAGGTQLLPRALGLERATTLILSGAVRPAGTFEGTALIRALALPESLIETARVEALAIVDSGRPLPHLGRLTVSHPRPDGFLAFARAQAKARKDFVPSMLTAIDGIALSLTHPALDGLRAEFELFRPLVDSPPARAVRHAFFAERLAPQVDGLTPGAVPRTITRALVVGAGYMGGGIAHCLVQAGMEVLVHDAQHEAAARCVERLQAEPALAHGRVSAVRNLAEAVDVDLAIEAVAEDLAVKQALFQHLDQALAADAILATNTSTLDLNAIASATQRPAQVLGLHFFGPASVMRLLEVVRGAQTSDGTLQTGLQLAQRLRKVPVVSRVGPGFVANRIYASLMAEALALISEGVAPVRVDAALEHFGWRMGPFRTMDLIGIDVLVKGRLPGVPLSAGERIQDALVERCRFGQKSGKGWYDYGSDARQARPSPEVLALLPAAAPMDARAITERCMLALINEACRVLDDGTAQRASDIDLCFLLGYGFPRLKGGPLFHAMELGLPVVQQRLEALQRDTGDARWQPSRRLTHAAAAGQL